MLNTFSKKSASLLAAAAMAAVFACGTMAHASTTAATWAGAGSDDNWSTSANWTSAGIPTSGNTTSVTFTGTVPNTTSNVNSAYTLNSLVFGTGSNDTITVAYTLTGSAITLSGSNPIINSNAGKNGRVLQTIDNNILLSPATGSGNFNAAIKSNNGNLLLAGTITNSGNGVAFESDSGTGVITVSGSLSGTFGQVVVGASSSTSTQITQWNGDNSTFNTNQLVIFSGTLQLGNANALGLLNSGSKSIQLNNGANTNDPALLTTVAMTIQDKIFLQTNGDGIGKNTVGGIGAFASTYTGNVILGSNNASGSNYAQPLTVTADSGGTVTFSGNLLAPTTLTTGTNDATTNDTLTKVGAGLVILSGTGNDYTGTTTVQAGNLQVNGALTGTGAVTVDSGATLSGVGSIAGAVTVNTGGILSPGDAPGTFTLSGGLTLANSGVLDFTLGSPNVAGGTGGNDLVSTAALTLGTGLTVHITQGAGYGTGLYHMIDYSGALTNNSNNFTGWTVTGLAAGQTAAFSLGADGTSSAVNLTISSSSIPEPTTLGLLALGSLGILAGRRWRSA